MTEPKDYQVICMACGMPLKRHEIAAQITGQTVDFNERIAVQGTNYYLCDQCAEKSKTYMAGGMKKAMERREEQLRQILEIDLQETGGKDPVIIGS